MVPRSRGRSGITQADTMILRHALGPVQRAPDGKGQLSAVHNVLSSPGHQLPDAVRTDMQARLGADFSGVRVHTGRRAHDAATSVQANAFTSGSHIVFREGHYDTSSNTGRHVLAHELTHVMQQRAGSVSSTNIGAGLRVSAPGDSYERAAQANATRAMNGHAPHAATTGRPAQPTAIQRAVGFEFEAQWNVREPSTDTEKTTYSEAERDYDRKAGAPLLAHLLTSEPAEALEKLGFSSDAKLSLVAELSRVAQEKGPVLNDGKPTESGLEWLARARELDFHRYRMALTRLNLDRLQRNELGEPPLPGKNLSKGEHVIDGDRFALTADSSPSGGSNLEWVTAPLNSRGEVKRVMNAVVEMIRTLNRRQQDKEIPVREIDPANPKPDRVIYPDGQPLMFAPQATAGLALGQIGDMVGYLTGTPAPRHAGLFTLDKPYMQRAAQNAAREVHDVYGNTAGTKELVGLVTLLCNYLAKADSMGKKANSKTIAGVLMSRTDFAHNFRQLPEPLRNRYEKNPEEFVSLVLEAAGTDHNVRVFPQSVERGTAGDRTETTVELARGDWLRNIVRGVDLLKNPKNSTLRPDFAGAEAIHASLGAMGTTADKVGPSNAQVTAIIAEFRRITDHQSVEQLQPLALAAYELVDGVNKGRIPSSSRVLDMLRGLLARRR
ncbi:DUF4157 domain-containing protein [Saccharopolyspora spinosa]|uniref:eCIS core domain-containing protein n=1 Tax=Saccharopolyspora spinosa TaxID=60894 RepID=UPI0002379609|nr:DUF4157 domain-containing protein [Saccharopolyspora spinosa]